MRNLSYKLFLLIFIPSIILADTIIKGTIKNEEGEPLPGANVFLEKTLDGTTSNSGGEFYFKTKKEGTYTLLIRFIGYREWKSELELKGETITIEAILRSEIIETGGITVRASSFTTGEEKGVTLTPLEIYMTPGSSADICWTIKSYPGLQQFGDNAGLYVRGGEVTETKFILDGALVYHPYRFESPTGGFMGTISPFLLKGTFFSSGGFGSEYGNSLSGILAMKSLDPPSNISFNLGAGLANLSILGSIPIKEDKLGINFSGNRSNTKLMFDFNRVEEFYTEYPYAYDFNFNLGYRYSKKGLAKFFFFKEKDIVGIKLDDPTWGGIYNGDGGNNLINTQIAHAISENFLLDVNFSYTSFMGNSAITVMETSILDLTIEDKINQGRFVFENPYWKLKYGGVFIQQKDHYKGIAPEEDSLDPLVPGLLFDTEYKSKIGACFIEKSFELPHKVYLTTGIRSDYEFRRKKYAIDPRFSLSWQPTKELTIATATGIFHQFPEPIKYDPEHGNPDLGPMEAKHYIISAIYKIESDIVRLEAYYKDYVKLIKDDDSLNFTLDGNGYARGLDFFIKKDFGIMSTRLSYSYVLARRNWNDFPYLSPPEFDITNNLNAIVNLYITENFYVGGRFIYSTGKPYTPGGSDFHSARLPDYYKLDFNMFYIHSFYPGNFTVFYLMINNFTNRINILDYHNGDESKPITTPYRRLYYFGISFQI
jgi:vitamin B12 transporter